MSLIKWIFFVCVTEQKDFNMFLELKARGGIRKYLKFLRKTLFGGIVNENLLRSGFIITRKRTDKSLYPSHVHNLHIQPIYDRMRHIKFLSCHLKLLLSNKRSICHTFKWLIEYPSLVSMAKFFTFKNFQRKLLIILKT